MKKKLLGLPLLLAALTVFAAAAGIPPAPTSGYIVDNAQVLDAGTVDRLNERGGTTVYDTGTSVVVITTDYTGTYALDEFCNAVFDEWAIEDGLVLTLAVADEDYYAMPSAELGRYLDSNTGSLRQEAPLSKAALLRRSKAPRSLRHSRKIGAAGSETPCC